VTLPTFVVIGAQKAGTTSLCSWLATHPQVFMSHPKEPGFFVETFTWARGLAWYESLFANAGDARAAGEGSTSYTMHPGLPGVPERMASVIPEARLVYVVRHPIERLVSAYVHARAGGAELRPVEQAVVDTPGYVNTSRYAHQLDQFAEWFPREQLLVLTSDELRADRERSFDRVLSFVDADPGWRPPQLSVDRNVGAEKRVTRSWANHVGGALLRSRWGDRGRGRGRTTVARLRRSPLLTRPVRPDDLVLADDLQRRLEDALRPDVARLRDEYLGPDFDGWGLL
jgi:hypothetical protein